MDAARVSGAATDPGSSGGPRRASVGSGPRDTTWRRAIDDLTEGLGAAASARLRVVKLEAWRAMQVSMVALALAGAAILMMLTAWFALVGSIVTWAVSAGYRWPWVLLAVAVVCILLGWLGIRGARASLSDINFDATARIMQRQTPGPAGPTTGGQ